MDRKIEKLTSRKNPVCVHIKKLAASRSYRYEQGQFLCEGKKLLEEAVKSGAMIELVISSGKIESDLPETTQVYYATASLIESLSPLKTSQGLLFTCRMPQIKNDECFSGTHLLLDSIQDPGNIGSIIRSAHAFNIKGVILTDGCADIYNIKTIRASMGAIFKQSVFKLSQSEIIKLKQSGFRFIGTTSDRSSTCITEAKLEKSIIILGNEGQGISKQLLDICDEMITIPLTPESESLNVAIAAAIILWETAR